MSRTSERYESYFAALDEATQRAYDVARKARSRGLDPAAEPEIPRAQDLAERVENLVGPEGVAEEIRRLSEEMDREAVSLEVAKAVARGEFVAFDRTEDALDAAVRTGLAILTEGVLVAPLEGIADVKIQSNEDGRECATLVFAGPIRSAGGTGEALSVLIADVVRRELGLDRFRATHAEIERYKEEIPAYKRAVNLQYTPDADEIATIVEHCPVGLDGEGTSDKQVSGYRNLPRVETDRLRGGACLVIAEGIAQKVPKLKKHVDRLGMDGWGFLDDLYEDEEDEDTNGSASLGDTYLKDLVAGRPVLGHPERPGGLRLRYGRSRTAGLASTAIHPALMVLVDDFLAVGTQLKIAGPGKATVATPCDAVRGPTVLLEDGDLVGVDSVEQARELGDRVEEITDLGEVLIPFGEFLENNKPLLPGAYVEEWWAQEVRQAGHEPKEPGSAEDAIAFAEATGTPLHPRSTLLWHDLARDDLVGLRETLVADGRVEDDALRVPADAVRDHLVALDCVHRHDDGEAVVDDPLRLLAPLGLAADGDTVVASGEVPDGSAMDAVRELAPVEIRPRAPTRIGARVGRPEKAAPRKMKPPVHVIFPLGRAGGMQRQVKEAVNHGSIEVEVGMRTCVDCGSKTPLVTCRCGGRTEPTGERPKTRELPMAEFFDRAKERIGEGRVPEVKGVRGTMSEDKTPEPLEKGMLRAMHDVWVFKDGTLRYDMTDVPLTHVRPDEIDLSVERARELGYTEDVHGDPLESPDQVVELKVQDLVVPRDCAEYLLRCTSFVDDLLVRYYHLDPFYEADAPEDLIGHLVVGLAPHTSGGVLGRIVGFVDAQGGFAHPYFHAAKRRNCDGDEDCVMLLLDGLLNFSRTYLPASRGGLMDAPLVVTTRIDPAEIDKEAHNLDVGWSYPIELYEAAVRGDHPKEALDHVEIAGDRIGEPDQYEGFGYTHETADMCEAPPASAYKTLGSMVEKMEAQLGVGARIRAVDVSDVAGKVITTHFLPDLVGNLKAFSRQQVRCAKCNTKYRRVPLDGRCRRCDRELTMTVHEASVTKYLDIAKEVAETYGVGTYTQQRIELVEQAIESLFTNDKVTEATLEDFY